MTTGSWQTNLTRLCMVLGIVLFSVSGYVWYTKIYTDPSHIFWDTADNSLATTAVTREVSVDNHNNGQTLDQLSQLQFGGRTLIASQVKLSDTEGNSRTVETLVTPKATYTRIISLTSKTRPISKQAQGQVLNVWSKTEATDNSAISSDYRSVLPGLVPAFPIANLTQQQRSELVHYMQSANVFSVDFADSKQSTEQGRTVRTYKVTPNAEQYITLLKRLGEMTGMDDYKNTDPKQFQGKTLPASNVVIDIKARRMISVTALETNTSEKYVSYGVATPIDIPADTAVVPASELNERYNTLVNQQ